jgi:hypothetical protein
MWKKLFEERDEMASELMSGLGKNSIMGWTVVGSRGDVNPRGMQPWQI